MSIDRDDHDKHMDQLALRIGRVLHGEDLFDAACACGLIIAFSLRERFSNDPKAGRDALAKVINFITERFESSDFENLDDEHT